MRRRTVTARAAAVLIAGSLVLAGCGHGDSSDGSSDGPDAQNVAAGAEIKATWPGILE